MDNLLYEFCGNESFLNDSLLKQDIPTLTNCFQDTLPVWVACGYLLIVSVPFTVFLVRSREAALPHSPLYILKLVTCLLLACLVQLHFSFRQMYGDGCAGSQVQSYSGNTAVWIKFVSFMCAGALLHVQKTCGNRTSGIPFTFWLLILVAESCRLYSYLLENVVCGTQVVFYVYYSCIVMQLVLYCWAEKQPGLNPNKIPCPMDSASVLNRIFYHWLTTTIYSVYKERFSREKMWLQTVKLRSSIIGPRLYKVWQTRLQAYLRLSFRSKRLPVRSEEKDDMSTSFTESTQLLDRDQESRSHQQRDGQNNAQIGRPSLLRTVLRTFIWELCEFVGYGVCSFCAWFLIPIVLRQLLDYVEMKNSPDDDPAPAWVGVAYVVGLCAFIEISSITSQTTLHHSMTFGLKVKSALMYVIYKKALSVARTQQTMSVGEISSLMAVDCQRIQDATMYLYYIPLFGLVISAFTWQIISIVGVAATIGGLLMLAAFLPITVYIGYQQNLLQSDILFLKGLRIRVINEVLTGIKVLKMYAWEPTFQQKIEEIRLKETKLLRKNTILLAIVTTLANHAQYMVHFVMITVYVVLSADHFISSTVVFVSLSLVILIKYIVSWFPTVLSGVVQDTHRDGAGPECPRQVLSQTTT